MKIFYILIILFFFQNCSFDNKSGIWNNESNPYTEKKNQFKDFKKLSTSQEFFDKIIPIDKKIKIHLPSQINPNKWNEIFYNQYNNYENFQYNNLNKINFKSKKLSKYKIDQYILYENNNLIFNDKKGNVISYSLQDKKIISKFNFYKKEYKKYEKELNFIVKNNVIYVSDNLGYLYAYNYKENRLIWAKNYKIPFNSNFKISQNFLFTSNIINNFIILDKYTGNILEQIPTEEILVQNNFKNNLSQNKDTVFFLNTFGTLYAINKKKFNIKWFVNLNPSLDLNVGNLFYGNQIVYNNNLVIISTNKFTYVIDALTGSIIYKLNFTSLIKPIITDKYFFSISDNDLLIAFDLKNGKIIYSYDINEKISLFLNTKKKKTYFNFLTMTNDDLMIFLENSFVLRFDIRGNLKEVNKLPSKILSKPIFINRKVLYFNTKKKLVVLD